MNVLFFLIYIIGFVISTIIQVIVDPPDKRKTWNSMYPGKASASQVGFEVAFLACLWPILLPIVLIWLVLAGFGRLLGVRD